MNTATTSTKNLLNQKLLSYFIYHKPLADEEFIAMHTIKDGKAIFEQGNHPAGVYYILQGKVKYSWFAQSGSHHIFHIGKEGDFVGYKDAILNKRYSYSAIAWEDVTYYYISYKLFKNVMDNNYSAASKFCKMLCEDLMETEEKLVDFSRMNVKARLADALLSLKKHVNGGGVIAVPRLELAQMVGTATETIIRMLSELNEKKVIDTTRRGEIKILNEKALVAMTAV